MKKWKITPKKHSLIGVIDIPGDKSLSHRSAIFGMLADGVSKVRNYLMAEDCLNTLKICEKLGATVVRNKGVISIRGCGFEGMTEPDSPLYCGNSGTTMRLMAGLLAGAPFNSSLSGDKSLSGRPMDRVAGPLSKMGARIKGNGARCLAPLYISGRQLKGIRYRMPIPSAQVKSSILLASLGAKNMTVIEEPIPSRDHTERFFKYLGQDFHRKKSEIRFKPGRPFRSFSWEVPGDTSSAAFFLCAGAIVPDSNIKIKNVLWNQGRIGVIRALKRMGANLTVSNRRKNGPEWTADLRIKTSKLKKIIITEKQAPSLIDEFPVLMVAATQAAGVSKFFGVDELRVKETDRVWSMVSQLKKMGAEIEDCGDHIRISGPTPLRGAGVKSFGDHRTAMSFAIAGLIAKGRPTTIQGIDCINTSFPDFPDLLGKLGCRLNMV